MAKLAIIGGKLQGLEAVYLAAKAGLETILIDKRENPIARSLCNHFICCNVLDREKKMIDELIKADLVLPALEDEEVLKVLVELADEYQFKLAFDLNAYMISSSKILSDRLIYQHNIPAPCYFPDCKAPYIVKPSNQSGSTGVKYFNNTSVLESFLNNRPQEEQWVAQEFLSGRSFSIEIIGEPGNYRTYEITEIHMDEIYDCKRVTAPCDIKKETVEDFQKIAVKLAEILKLKGIMDVEVIDDNGILKVLEIDARIPSQTPIAVYHSSGINQVQEIYDLFCKGKFESIPQTKKKYASFEHLLICNHKIEVKGEHIMGEAGPLKLIENFCGSDEAITDYQPGNSIWRGTFINSAESENALQQRREIMFKQISSLQGEELELLDLSPDRQL